MNKKKSPVIAGIPWDDSKADNKGGQCKSVFSGLRGLILLNIITLLLLCFGTAAWAVNPRSTITNPTSGSSRNATFVTITGTATSDTDPVLSVGVRIYRQSDVRYWDGTAGTWTGTSSTFNTASGTTSWTYPWPTTTTGVYTVTSRASDITGVESPGHSVTFNYDLVNPSSSITIPTDGSAFNNTNAPPNFTGTATDAFSGVDTVEIRLRRVSDSTYWSGSAWVPSANTWVTVTGTTSWSYPWPTAAMTQDGNYFLQSRARDKGGNVQDPGVSGVGFTYDTQRPSSSISSPPNGSKINSLTQITGNSSDIAAGIVDRVEVRISRPNYPGGIRYFNYNTGTWVTSPDMWFVATGTDPWSFPWSSSGGAPITVSDTYTVNSRAIDKAENRQDPPASIIFIFDQVLPTSQITSPTNGLNTDTLTQVRGTASDALTGISNVEITIRRADGLYWNGTTWVSSPFWLSVTSPGTTWYHNWPALGNGTYTLQSRARDGANNYIELPTTSVTFTIDSTNPTSSITAPLDGQHRNSLINITGVASDNVSVTLVEVSIQKTGSAPYLNYYWNGSAWVLAQTWLSAAGTNVWSYPWPTSGLVTDDQYTLQSRARDNAGNIEIPTTSVTFVYDRRAPISNVTNPTNGAVINSLTQLNGNAADSAPGVVNRVEISIRRSSDRLYYNGVTWVGSQTWLLASGTTTWNYLWPSLADDVYTINSKAYDAAGNIESPGAGITFTLNRSAPASTVTSPANRANIKSITQITGTAADDKGIALVQISIRRNSDSSYWNGTTWAGVQTWLTATGTNTWTYPFTLLTGGSADGSYTIQSRATDTAGNMETPSAGNTFNFDSVASSSTIFFPANGANLNAFSQITGTATDATSGVYSVEVSIRRGSTGLYWNGSNWVVPESWIMAVGTNNWSLTRPATMPDDAYTLRSRAWDYAGNIETIFTPGVNQNTFNFDTQLPSSVITTPANGLNTNSLNQIVGTASDALSGVNRVEASIKRNIDNYYWTGSFWSSTQVWLPATGTTNWTYPWPNPGGGSYTIQSRAIDNANNQESPGPGNTFTFSPVGPTSTITNPVHGTRIKTLPQIQGTATPGSALSPVTRVDITIKRVRDNWYWNGAAFQSALLWLPAAGTTNWTYPWPSVSSNTYNIQSRATDSASNVETPGAGNTFIYDTLPPTSIITSPASGAYLNTLAQISGTATDNLAGVASVEITIRRNSDGQYWNESTWQGSESWRPAAGTNTWTYTWPAVGSDLYAVRSRATDGAGNIETPGTGISFTYDISPPSSTVTTPANGAALPSLANILGTASDNFLIAQVQVNIRRDTDGMYWQCASANWGNTQGWCPVTGTTSWSYPWPATGDGFYTVRSRAQDQAGNIETPTTGSSFTLDRTKPVSNITYPINGSSLGNLTAITGTASDNLSGVTQVQVRIRDVNTNLYWNGSAWVTDSSTWLTAAGTNPWSYPWPGSISDGTYQVQSRATDGVGNIETPGTGTTFTLDTTRPTSRITYPVNGTNLNSIAAITGTSTGDTVEVSIQRLSDNLYWNGANWVGSEIWRQTTGAANWTFTWPALLQTTENNYRVRSRATDGVGNTEVPGPGVSFTLDIQAPASQIASPLDGQVLPSLSAIVGTATDNLSGVANVKITIKRSNGHYWNGNYWVIPETWLNAVGTTSWTYTWPAGLGDDNYLVYSRAADRATNQETPGDSVSFRLDTSRPGSTITSPQNGVIYSALSNITGRATDDQGVNKVEISIRHEADNKYWDRSNWVPTERWLLVTGTSNWSDSWPIVAEGTYTIRSRATDNSGNVEIPGLGVTFILDKTPPASQITTPANGAKLSSLAQIVGWANDAFGVSEVRVSIRNDMGNYWNGTTWAGTEEWLLATGTTSWSYNFPEVGSGGYTVRSKATDAATTPAANVETPGTGNSFTLDLTGPASSIADPANGSIRNTFNQITGTATSPIVGIDYVEVSIRRHSTGFYWNGVSWVSTERWIRTTGTTNWTYPFAARESDTYTVRSRAYDRASNIEAPAPGNTFIFDTLRPASTITNPVSGAVLNALTQIQGTASDNLSGVQKVEISIKRVSDNAYWNGTGWGGSIQSWLNVTGTTTWIYTWTAAAIGDGEYLLQSRATDNATNAQIPGLGHTFKFDTIRPSSSIDQPLHNARVNSLNKIIGTASDNLAGVIKVELTIQRTSDWAYWNGISWVSAQVWLLATGTTSWSCLWPPGLGDGDYNLQSRATDAAGNVEVPTQTTTFTMDKIGPTSNVGSPADGAKLKTLAAITGTAVPNKAPVNKVEISLRRTSDARYWNGGTWVSVPTPVWLLATGTNSWTWNWPPGLSDAEYTVFSRAHDEAGNIEPTTNKTGTSFILDTTPPTSKPTELVTAAGQPAMPVEGAYINSIYQLKGTADDALAGVDKVEITLKRKSNNWYWTGLGWGPTETWFSAGGTISWSWNWPAGMPNDAYEVKSRATDKAGNIQVVFTTVSFYYDTSAPVTTIIQPHNGEKLNKLDRIKGTASDALSGAANVKITIQRKDSKYWNGSSWVGSQTWLTAVGTDNWYYTWPGPAQMSDDVYTVCSRGEDMAGNLETSGPCHTFTFDQQLPASAICGPLTGATVNTLTQIMGKAGGAGTNCGTTQTDLSGIDEVRVFIKRNSDQRYWNKETSSWVTDRFWLLTTGTDNWSLAWPGLGDGAYTLVSRAVDGAGNLEVLATAVVFTFDATPPSSKINNPVNGSNIRSLTKITGTAIDETSTVNNVKVSIKKVKDGDGKDVNLYWDGVAWVVSEFWLTTTGTTIWEYNWPGLGGGSYTIRSKATDAANNPEIPGTGVSFILAPPCDKCIYSEIISPANGDILRTLTQIKGTAEVPLAGIAQVEITIKRKSDGKYWTRAAWTSTQTWLQATGTNSWTYNWPSLADDEYTIVSKATDNAGRVETPGPGITFILDATPPASNISFPGEGNILNQMVQIIGNANDNLAGVEQVQISLKREDGYFWNGSSWETFQVWLKAIGTTPWAYNWPAAITDGRYVVTSKAKDRAGNWEIPKAGPTFTFDLTGPGSTFTAPLNSQSLNKLDKITGTASDNLSGISRLELSIQRESDLLYWNGGNWVANQTYLSATGTTDWSYKWSASLTDGRYTLNSRATDLANNVQGQPTKIIFTYDRALPTSVINQPRQGDILNSLSEITGNADDNFEISKVEVTIKRESDKYYWNGWTWVGQIYWLDANGTTSWKYFWSPSMPDSLYTISSRATDAAGNVEVPKKGNEFTYDAEAPKSSILNPIAGAEIKTITSITGTAADNQSGVIKVWISLKDTLNQLYWNKGDWVATETWLQVTGTANWSYPWPAALTDRIYLVRSKARDAAGNEEAPGVGNTFTLDTQPPASEIKVPSSGDVLQTLPIMPGTATDNLIGVASVEVSLRRNGDSRYWDSKSGGWVINQSWQTANGSTSWRYNLPLLSSGSYTASCRARDKVGNLEIPGSGVSFIIDPDIPLSNITYPAEGTTLRKLDQIKGTAFDAIGVALVEVAIQNNSNQYWNGTTWNVTQSWLPAKGTNSWTFDWPEGVADDTYRVRSRATDLAGNIEATDMVTFTLDTTPPSATIISPGSDDVLRDVTHIIGSAVDNLSGIERVEVSIKQALSQTYWSGSAWAAWVTTPTWFMAMGTTDWTFSWPAAIWDGDYTVQARATDRVNNVGSPEEGNTFTLDKTYPASYISTPARDAVLGSLPQVKGTAADGLSSVARVEISIKKDRLYWSGIKWVTPQAWLPVNGTTSWSYIWPAGLGDGSYILTSRAIDVAGNEEIPFSETTFSLDTKGPVSLITSPQSGAILQSLSQIVGIASDEESGIKKVEVILRNETDRTYWNGSHWVMQEYWLPANGTTNWSFLWPVFGDRCYRVNVCSRATNGADIQEIPGPGVSFTVDSTPPKTVINAPREGDVLTYLKQITGTIQDGCSPIDHVEVAIKQKTTGSYWNGATWSPAQRWLRANGTSSWALTWPGLIGNGEYTILGRTVDMAGNVETSLDPGRNWINFMLDSTRPGSTIVSPKSGTMLNMLTQISGTANDDFSGVKKVEITIRRANDQYYWDGTNWQRNRILLQASGTNSWNYPWPQQAGDGIYTVTSQSTDQAGNLEQPLLGGVTFTLDAARPESRIIYPVNNQIITTSFQIAGTAKDNLSGIVKVEVAIRNKDGNYYNGSTWVAPPESWMPVQRLNNSWTYTWPKLDDGSYDLYSRATDLAGNVEMPSSPVHFTFVSKGPTSSITSLPDGKGLTALTQITGTAKDNLLRVTQVEVSIGREDIGTYWNGFSWVMTPVWVTVSGTEVWAYSWPQGSGDGEFTVWSRATNEAGMVETSGRGNTFSLDNTAPASWITSPIENATLTALTKIEGKSSDNLSGVSKVELSIKRNRDGNYWNGTNWAQGQSWAPQASGTTTWELAWPKTIDGSYTLQSRATDVAGNPENPQTFRNFTLVDKTAPSSQVTSPANGAIINKGLAMIQGTAGDDMSGVALVEVAVKRKSDGNYWDRSAWVISAGKLWLVAGGTDSWSSPWPAGVSDGDYLIYSRAQDLAGNIEIKEAGAQVTIDSILPASKPTSPSDGAVVGNLSQISGTASDNLVVSKVEVRIQRSGTGRYFTGTGWSATQTWLQAAGTNSWVYTLPVKIGEDDHYLITSRATDIAGNVESPTVTITVIIDTILPVSTITSPTDGQEINYLGQISGIVADAGGVAQIEVSIKKIANGTYWNGSIWQISQFWLLATGTTSWFLSWPGGAPEGSYLIQSRATDAAGHVEIPKKGNTVTIDTTAPPTPTLSLSDRTSGSQNYTDDREINVSIGNDAGVAEYLLSETLSSTPGSSDWQALGTKTKPATYTLRPVDGLKTVYLWVRDKAGNVNLATVRTQITLDMSGPVITGIPTENSPDNDYDEDGRYTVYWNAASDPQSGVAGYGIQEKVGEDGQWTTLSSAVASGVTNYSITGRSKGKTCFYRVRAQNGVGNWGDYSSSSDGIEVADRIGSGGGTATDAQGKAKVDVPPSSFKDNLNVVIETDPINNPDEVNPDNIKKADDKKDINLGSQGLMEINLYDAWDQPVDNLSSAITIILSYPDKDQDGYVDGTQPPLNELTLKIYRLDETSQEWVEVPGSKVDPVANIVSAKINHTSVYRWWGSPTPARLTNPIVYPNPFKAGSEHDRVYFGYLPLTGEAEPAKMLSTDTTIKIYSLSGELVQTIKEGEDAVLPNNGQAIWKVPDDIAAGLYFYIITNPSGDKVTGKLAIIR